MGWDYEAGNYSSLREYANELVNRYNQSKFTVIASSLRSNHLWMVLELEDGKRIISLCLLGKTGSWYGYKSMSENMGPCYYDCPIKFLSLQPVVTSEYSESWRNSVIEKNKKRK